MLVPKRMKFYCRKKGEDGVYPTFPVDAEASHETAEKWARDGSYVWDSDLRRNVKKEEIEIEVFEFDNSGFGDITIEGLDIRRQGGRAYQVIIDVKGDRFRVDLREDTLMDVIRLKGVQSGGRLNGTFCFTKNSGQTNLILEGTKRHQRGVDEREKREENKKTIKKSELKVGHLYETITGNGAVFIGHVYAVDVNEYTGEVSKPYRGMLWLEKGYKGIQNDHNFYNRDSSENSDEEYKDSFRGIEIKKSHSYRVDKGKVLEDVNLDNYIKNTKAQGKEDYKKYKRLNKEGKYFWGWRIAEGYIQMTIEKDRKDIEVVSRIEI